MFPADWSDKKGQSSQPSSKKRKLTQKEELKGLLEQCSAGPTPPSSHEHDEGIVGMIKRQVNNSKFAPATPEEIQLDHILSSVPYQSMLESLFSNVSQVSSVPLVTKAYEESFMRESETGERSCVMGPKCECMFIDPNAPFVSVTKGTAG